MSFNTLAIKVPKYISGNPHDPEILVPLNLELGTSNLGT
jgi:hypothetical protein